VIPKGEYDTVKAAGIEAFQRTLVEIVPFLGDRVTELKDWDQIRLLTVLIDRLREWYRDGLLCIGDAAHAMSPVGGVGINLAIQDAVAAANILTGPLKTRRLMVEDLRAVQRRRELPTRVTQRLQVTIQNNVFVRTLQSGAPTRVPRVVRLLNTYPVLRRIPAFMVGLGVRPEHVQTPEVRTGASARAG
jgi:2-polyprenyl-6-methoxyphenol hydroxylase-like FAD-dependent oxidoreductase